MDWIEEWCTLLSNTYALNLGITLIWCIWKVMNDKVFSRHIIPATSIIQKTTRIHNKIQTAFNNQSENGSIEELPNTQSNTIEGSSKIIDGGTVEEIEAWGFLLGLQLARKLGEREFIIEGGCQLVTKLSMEKEIKPPWRIEKIIKDC